jgi:hypothetical protein
LIINSTKTADCLFSPSPLSSGPVLAHKISRADVASLHRRICTATCLSWNSLPLTSTMCRPNGILEDFLCTSPGESFGQKAGFGRLFEAAQVLGSSLRVDGQLDPSEPPFPQLSHPPRCHQFVIKPFVMSTGGRHAGAATHHPLLRQPPLETRKNGTAQ